MMSKIKSNLIYALSAPEFRLSNDECIKLINSIDKDGKFGVVTYDESSRGYSGWNHHMATLYNISSNPNITKSSTNRELIFRALDFFLEEHRSNSNWWFNDIGIPNSAGNFYLLMENYLSDEQKSGLLGYVKQGSIPLLPPALKLWHGANLMWGVDTTVKHAIIENDPSLMYDALEAVEKDVAIRQNGEEGIQPDFTFFQHQTQFYTGGYGYSFTVDFARLVYILSGTEYQFSAETLSTFANFIIYGIRFGMRNQYMDFLTVGREISRPNALVKAKLRDSLILLQKVEEMPCRNVMQEQLASLGAEGYSAKGVKFFPESNYMTHRSTTYHIGCHGTSPLRSLGETINDENFLSGNLYAGGAMCIMSDGQEYHNIFPLWDYSHIPGTTALVQTDDEIKELVPQWHGTIGKNNYCGGLSHNNFGILYQDLNFNHVTGVTARFFVDDVVIVLGAGITAECQKRVTTTLNQCWKRQDVITEKEGLPPNTVYHDRIAYCSLDQQPLVPQVDCREDSWTRINLPTSGKESGEVFSLWIDHGIAPQNVSYAYAIIPAVSRNTAKERIEDVVSQISVLRNDEKVQAIQYKGKTLCVFHKNDTFSLAMYDKLIATGPSAYIL